MDAEAVLLVDHREAQPGEAYGLLKQRMGADNERDGAAVEPIKDRLADLSLVAASQKRHRDSGLFSQRFQTLVMLTGEDFGRRHECGLPARLDRGRHCEKGDDGFSGADIALQQAEHFFGRGEIAPDIGKG